MTRLRMLFRNLFHRRSVEEDLDDEVRSYVEMLEAEGVSHREAMIETGGVEQVKEQVREVRAGAFVQSFAKDLRYASRTLLKNRSFTAVAVLALALGIGANTAIFSVVYGVLWRPLPYRDADRVAMVYMHFSPQNAEHGTMSIADYLDWRAQNRAFQDPQLFRHSGYRFDISGVGEPEQVLGTTVTAGFFKVLESAPLLGRAFQEGDDRAAAPRLVVVSENLWRRRFAANPNAIGQAILLNGAPVTIVGVMPATFQFPAKSELWTNLRLTPPTRRGPFPYIGIGRLKPGVTFEQVQAETNALGRRIEREHPYYNRLTMPVVSLRDDIVGKAGPTLLTLLGAVAFVLLIAMVNVANLLLARANVREREMAIRTSLGASRGRIVRQLLTESSLLALLGGLAGCALAYAGVQLLRQWNPGNLPRIEDVHLDARVLSFTFAISLVAGILFGLAPALETLRADLSAPLKEGGRSNTGSEGRRRIHALLVICELAMSLVLLVGAGLLLRSFAALQRVDPGFHAPPNQVLTMNISSIGPKYANERDGGAFQTRVIDAVRRLPGVEFAAVSDSLPPDYQNDYDTFQIEGQVWNETEFPAVVNTDASTDYFRSLGIPLIRGRSFSDSDTLDAPLVIVISESLARRYFVGQDPVGRRMKVSGPYPNNPWMRIVGVVGDVKYWGLERDDNLGYYVPASQSFNARTFLYVRSARAASIAPEVRRKIHEIDANVAVTNVRLMDEVLSSSVARPRFRAYLIGVFAGLALTLAAIGIYGVISYSVTQRTQEIGIRAAMGAKPFDILRMVTGQGLRLTLIGLGAGIAIALALTHLLKTLLFGVSATDFTTFASVSALLCGVALLACLAPAMRAMRVDPIVALRHE